jgi:hypothetical protein
MRILFAISLVALAALLWASVSIAQHIYRSRQRHRKLTRETKPRTIPAVPPASIRASNAGETRPQRKAS